MGIYLCNNNDIIVLLHIYYRVFSRTFEMWPLGKKKFRSWNRLLSSWRYSFWIHLKIKKSYIIVMLIFTLSDSRGLPAKSFALICSRKSVGGLYIRTLCKTDTNISTVLKHQKQNISQSSLGIESVGNWLRCGTECTNLSQKTSLK